MTLQLTFEINAAGLNYVATIFTGNHEWQQ